MHAATTSVEAGTGRLRGGVFVHVVFAVLFPFVCVFADAIVFGSVMSVAPAFLWSLAIGGPVVLALTLLPHAGRARQLAAGLALGCALCAWGALMLAILIGMGMAGHILVALVALLVTTPLIVGQVVVGWCYWRRARALVSGAPPWPAVTLVAMVGMIVGASTLEVADRAYFDRRLSQLESGDIEQVERAVEGLRFYPLMATYRDDQVCWAIYHRSSDSLVDAEWMHEGLEARYGADAPRAHAAAARLFGPDPDTMCSAILWRGVN